MRIIKTVAIIVFLASVLSACTKTADLCCDVKVYNSPVLALKEMNRIADITFTPVSDSVVIVYGVTLKISAENSLGDIEEIALLLGDSTVCRKPIKVTWNNATVKFKRDEETGDNATVKFKRDEETGDNATVKFKRDEETGNNAIVKFKSDRVIGNNATVKLKCDRVTGNNATVKLKCDMAVDKTFSIGLKMADEVDLDNKITIRSIKILTSEGVVEPDCNNAPVLRTGVALRQNRQDNVDNCRIPGLAMTNNGTLIAIYDARRDLDRDLQGNIDICYNRSTDGGRSWSPMEVAMDMGEWGGLPQKFNGVSDPCILVDANSENIYIAACWMHGVIDGETGMWLEGLTEESKAWNHQWRKNGTRPGYDVKQSSQWMVVKSCDDGKTWSEPVNYTSMVKPEEYCLMINAPGAGITLEDGTLVFPAQGRREDGTNFSTIIWSSDGGVIWQAGTPAVSDHTIHSNECMAVQLADGSIMLNMRSMKNRGNHSENGRLVYVTSDLGHTWTEHPTSGHVLTEPACQGSLLKHIYKDASGQEQELLLFFNPNDPDVREHLSMKCSIDEGMTWPQNMWLELDEGRGAGYSCMVSLDNDTIGVVYEGSGACLVYQQVKVADILQMQ